MVEITLKIGEEEKHWKVQNPKVDEILKRIPTDKISEYLEMYILIGDTVLNYASIQTSEETIEKYFGGLIKELTDKVKEIAELREKVEEGISEDLPKVIKEKIESEMKIKLVELKSQVDSLKEVKDNIPDTIKAQLNEYIAKLEDAVSNIKTSSGELSQFIGKYRGSKERGEIGEDFVYNFLVDSFKDDSFVDVSEQGNYSDIKVQSPYIVDILTEVKNYKNPVPVDQVQKFWNDLDTHNISVGCFISLGTRIQGGIGDYKIESNSNKLGIFMNVGQFTGQNGMLDGIKLAYFITRKFAQHIKEVERERIEEGVLRQKINAIFKELSYLESRLDELKQVREKLGNIEKTAKECIKSIDDFYGDTLDRIGIIMREKEDN